MARPSVPLHPHGRVALSWRRRTWLRCIAWVEDHPWIATAATLGVVLMVSFYGIRLGGWNHCVESFARWRVETFGGVHEIDRSVRMYDVLMSFRRDRDRDRVDVASMATFHVTGRSFLAELKEIVRERGGVVRVVSLDPRLADPAHPSHAAFAAQAEAFGQRPWEFGACCWHSTAVLIHLSEELGERFEVRFLDRPSADAVPPHFSIGRSLHVYRHDEPSHCVDVLIPRPAEGGSDSLVHPTVIVCRRPRNPEVVRFRAAFERLWESAIPMDATLKETLLDRLDG